MANNITIRVRGNSGTVQVPGSWNDLSYRDLLLLYSTMFSAPGDALTATSFTNLKLIGMAAHLLKVDLDFLKKWEADCVRYDRANGQAVFYDELRQVVDATMEGLMGKQTDDDGNTTYSVKLNLSKNPYPSLAMQEGKKTKWLYGPSDGLGNLTVYELGMVFSYFEAYASTKKEEYAEKMLAVLYRPSRPETREDRERAWSGDRRQPLRGYEARIDERAAKMKTLPMLTKQVLVFWFASCRQQIMDRYPKVFRGGDGKAKNNYGWGGILMAVAENGALGNLAEVSDNHYSNALTLLSIKADEAEAAEQRMRESSRRR